MKSKSTKIAIHFQSEVQFFSLKPLLSELIKSYDVDILIQEFKSNPDINSLAKKLIKILKNEGYTPKIIEKLKDETYDLYITPYIDGIVKSKCYVKYEYGTLNIKPSATYTHEAMGGFDCFLCQSKITSLLLSAYGTTFPVENLRFYNKKANKNDTKRKRLLFAPTFNDCDNENELQEILENLKQHYTLIIKGHHGTDYSNNKSKRDIFKEYADEYYGSETELADLILQSDVCLFGNSSAIGEALFAKKPFAIFSSDLDYFKLNNIHTTQYKIVENDLAPYCSRSKDIVKTVNLATTEKYIQKQLKLHDEQFTPKFKTGTQGYLDTIEYILNHIEDIKDAKELRNLRSDSLMKEIERLNSVIAEKEKTIAENNELFELYSRRKLYKLSDMIYKILKKD